MGKKLTAYGVYLAKTSEEYLNKYQHRYAIHIKELGVSEDTLDRFMGGNIINDKNFDTICEKLRIPNLYF
ncbi:MAG: hypothetical protein N5P05_004406 (plasmid) [Chroococcopsis gigantea SAG 12.99]|nr:hypothetical protein [Chroococcopsis gigantea SAG 12.99]